MENLREDFILDNQLGDYITVMLQNGVEWTGTILDWNERRVRIEVGGVPRSVGFGIISAYYPAVPAKKAASVSQPPSPSPAEQIPLQPQPPRVAQVPEPASAPAPVPPAKPVKPLSLAEQAAKRVEEARYRIAYDPDLVQERLRLAPNTIEKERATALFQSFQRLLSQSGGQPDQLEARRILAAADKLSEQYPESPLTQSVIGEIALRLENWDQAEECFYAAGAYARAFFAAEKLENEDKLAEDGACHLLYEKKKEPEVVCSFLRLAAGAEDLSVFRRFLQTDGDRYPELVADGLCWLLKRAELPLPCGDGIAEPTVVDAMQELFDKLYPDPVESQMSALERPDEEPAPAPSQVFVPTAPVKETGLTGYLYDYSTFRKIGRVHGETKPDWFFHLNHIIDVELREMLELAPGRRYLVTFDVGHNSSGPCATNIRLTDRAHPYAESPASGVRIEGTITRFFPAYMNGQISANGESYNFRVDEMSDPLLRDYCTVFPDAADRQLKVTFTLRLLRDGKLVAVDIRSAAPFSEEETKRIADAVEKERHHQGVIFRYYPSQQRGQIEDSGIDYLFDLEQVSDPNLRSYLLGTPDVITNRIKVTFAAVRQAGRPFAENIRWLNDTAAVKF